MLFPVADIFNLLTILNVNIFPSSLGGINKYIRHCCEIMKKRNLINLITTNVRLRGSHALQDPLQVLLSGTGYPYGNQEEQEGVGGIHRVGQNRAYLSDDTET